MPTVAQRYRCRDRALRQVNGSRLSPCAPKGAAMIKISLVITSDSFDGQPWPPSDENALWVIVRRRADGGTLWRTIQHAQVRSAAMDLGTLRIGGNRN